jgi:predicted anti-sigma-YlaC factor YlaD
MLTIKRLMTQHMPGMLTCEEVDGFLYDFHEGNLSYVEKFTFKLHLSMCRECRDYLEGYVNAIRISQAGFIKTNQATKVPEDLMQAILKSRTSQ